MRNSGNSITSFSLEEMEKFQDKLFAVHITSDIPCEYKQIASNTNLVKNLMLHQINYAPLNQPTLHWCIGRTIPKYYNNIAISERNFLAEAQPKYAIITQLKNLFPKLININLKYTITFDEYLLTNKDYILLPDNENEENKKSWNTANIVYYNPKSTSLEKAITNFIKNQNGIVIEEKLENILDTNINFLHKYVLSYNQKNIYYVREKDPYIFNNIIKQLDISFGTDEEIVNGYFLGYLKGIQEKIISYILDLITSDIVEFGYTIEYIELLEYSAKCIQTRLLNIIKNCPRFSEKLKQRFNHQQEDFYNWLKIYELEKYLYIKYYRTMMGVNKKYINEIIKHLEKPIEWLINYIDENFNLFNECIRPNMETYYLEKIYLVGLAFFRKILLEDFEQISCFSNNPGHVLLYVLAHIKNGAIFEPNDIDTDKMLNLLNKSFKNLCNIENHVNKFYTQKILTIAFRKINLNSDNDEPVIYGGQDVIAFLANKCNFFQQFLMLNITFLNANYNLNNFPEKLFLYNHKKNWFPKIKPALTVDFESNNINCLWLTQALTTTKLKKIKF